MPAKCKADLIRVTISEFEKLSDNLRDVSEALGCQKDAEDTSIKDVLGHRAHWIELFFGWYKGGQAGENVQFPAAGYKWNELKRYNAELRERQAGLSWHEALEMLGVQHAALVLFLEGRSEQELYGRPMKGARNSWTTGRWAEAAGPSHYRSATKYVRAKLRAAR